MVAAVELGVLGEVSTSVGVIVLTILALVGAVVALRLVLRLGVPSAKKERVNK